MLAMGGGFVGGCINLCNAKQFNKFVSGLQSCMHALYEYEYGSVQQVACGMWHATLLAPEKLK